MQRSCDFLAWLSRSFEDKWTIDQFKQVAHHLNVYVDYSFNSYFQELETAHLICPFYISGEFQFVFIYTSYKIFYNLKNKLRKDEKVGKFLKFSRSFFVNQVRFKPGLK